MLDYSKQFSQLSKERDVAMRTLQQHGLVLGDQEDTTEVEHHVSLKQQNSKLRHVISEMRREMEAMSSDIIKDDEPATIAAKGVSLNSSTFQTRSLCVITQVILSSWKKNWHY